MRFGGKYYFLIITDFFFLSQFLTSKFYCKELHLNFFHSDSKFPNDLTFNNDNDQKR